MERRSLKNRLVSAVLVLVMLFTSFVGTTFAWFSDSRTSSGNKIESGTLKVDLLHEVSDGNWTSLKEKPKHKIFDYDKWEPGYTRVETLKILNEGTLAFKYKLSVVIEANTAILGDDGERLSDVIELFVTYEDTVETSYNDIKSSAKWTRIGTLTDALRNPSGFIEGILLPAGKSLTGNESSRTQEKEQQVKIALHMIGAGTGNEYQDLSIGNIYVNLVATQVTNENDSFGSDYDKDAIFPELNLGGIRFDVVTSNNVVTQQASVSDSGVTATVPAGVVVGNGVDQLSLSVREKEQSDANLTLNDGEALRALDVHISGVAADNTVPIFITIEKAMKAGLNIGNYTLYHVEGGSSNAMTAVTSPADLDKHNEFYYDPATGDVTLAMSSFSEVAMVAEAENAWEGKFDYTWYDASKTELTIANADQLAAFGAIVGGMNGQSRDSFEGKTVKLLADINLGDKDNASKNVFYPIGYYNNTGSYEKVSGGSVASSVSAFEGTFDGNGNTIANFYQNTWEMFGDYNDGYSGTPNHYKDAMGLFGYVYGGTVKNLTVSNFSSDGEYTPTGVIAAYVAGNSTFENIAITNCNPRVYNTGNGGIIGIAGDTSAANDDHITLKNITVDNSNKISALWGSWDVACGGLVGMYRGNVDGSGNATGDTIHFENCHVSAQIDVYNDVCANYQYYAYRYAGMIIGSIRHNTTNENGRTVPDTTGISASGCTVNFGDWNDYYYCEFEKNSMASYSEDYQFSRVDKSEIIFDENGKAIGCTHEHTDAEDKRAVYLPFNNLFTGYGWGVNTYSLDTVQEFEGVIDLTEGKHTNSIEKFEGKVTQLINYTTIKLGDIFTLLDSGIKLVTGSITVSVVNVDDTNPVSETIVYDRTNWENTTIVFAGVGIVKITIQDYYFCTPTTIIVEIGNHDHVYTNTCDTTCNKCGDVRTIEHVAGTEVVENTIVPTCTANGSYDKVVYCAVCGEELSRTTVTVGAVDHNMVTDAAKAPTCTETGLTEGSHCTECDYKIAQDVVPALGHDYDAVVTNPDCVNGGYTTYTCACGHSYVANEVAALGHTKGEVVVENNTDPDCVNDGSYDNVTYCTVCGKEFSRETITVDALGHHMVTDAAKAPTCTETGLTEGSHCTECDHKVAQEVVPALGHDYDAVVTNPDCVNGGYTTYTCTCGDKYTDNATEALGHIESKFTGDFLYRVGNKNAVQLSSLFNIGKRSDVTVSGSNVSGNASVTVNGTSLQFSGTGVVKITLSSDCTCNDCKLVLELEVVDAVNATSATSAKSNNVVLLNDVGLYTIEVSGGYTLYGNGFKMTATSDPMYDTMRAGFVTLDNGTLDNVQIICPNFSYAIIYNSQIKDVANTAVPSDSSNDARGNVRSAVMVTGNSKIVNSYVHGGRAAIFLRSGNLLVDGSTISGGAAANIHALSAQSLTLRDATLIQKPFQDNVYETGNTLMGFSVLLECGEDGNSTPVILEGTLVQDAWINESYVKYTPDKASSIVENALGKTAYLHDLDGDGKKESLNLGFTYIPQENKGSANADVTDNRTNKSTIPYEAVEVGNVLASAKVYSYKNTNGTSDDFKNVAEYDSTKYVVGYVPTAQGATAPSVSFTDTNADRVFETKFDANDGRWESTLTVNLDNGNYTFSWDKFLTQKHGENLTYTVKAANGTEIDSSEPIALTTSGMTEYVLTVTDGEVTHTIYFTITASKTSIPDPVVSDTTGGTVLLVVKSKNSDWTVGIPALEGMKVKYYTADGEVILDLATLTPASKGKQNGTNNYWETTKDGYKLKVTCGVIHDTKSVYGMPVVVDNNGTMQLYFTISSTNGYVSTGTAARSVTLTYEFTDPNGKTISFTKNYNVKYADYKEVAQYSYSDFVNGTMTDLLTSSSGGGITECVTPDTLITLANGTQVRVDSLTGNEMLLVWNMETGKLDYAPIMFVDSDPTAEYEVIKLYFSDGTEVKVISEHGFWDYDLNKYIYLDKNAADYIGHTFAKQNGETLEKVQLVDVVIETEVTEAWSPVTVGHLCYFVNGMLSMPGGVGGLFNIFEVDAETMTYDYEQIEKDIETYGLFTYEELNAICPLSEDMFNAAGGAYLKISIGKGNLTEEELFAMIIRYSKFFN